MVLNISHVATIITFPQHPFIKKATGPEVLRSTIIAYLKAKKEKQIRLKREIAKLGGKTVPISIDGQYLSIDVMKTLSSSPPPADGLASPKKSTSTGIFHYSFLFSNYW